MAQIGERLAAHAGKLRSVASKLSRSDSRSKALAARAESSADGEM